MSAIKVYQTDDGSWVAAAESGWIPGMFSTDGAARLAALKMGDRDIVERLGHIYEKRPVSMAEVSLAITAMELQS